MVAGCFQPLFHKGIWAVDASSRTWGRFATLLHAASSGHCLEWHNAGSCTSPAVDSVTVVSLTLSARSTKRLGRGMSCLRCRMQPCLRRRALLATSCSLREATYIIAEDMEDVAVYDLQIYDFTARTWHLGAALPYQSDL